MLSLMGRERQTVEGGDDLSWRARVKVCWLKKKQNYSGLEGRCTSQDKSPELGKFWL